MRTIFAVFVLFFLFTGCRKVKQELEGKTDTPVGQFVKYTIHQGQQYCDRSTYIPVDVSEMKFTVRFDSSAIYTAAIAENQYDINKLYGFSDNNMDHHQYSARIGWRWTDDSLRLFGYVYNAGTVVSKELSAISIGSEVNCSIRISDHEYIFSVNGITKDLPRLSTTTTGKGYQLFPYFGGNEVAPHDVIIWIREDNGR
jgi:hypothetical protein